MAGPSICVLYIVLRYMLHLARTERCVNAYQGQLPTLWWQYSYHGKATNWFVATRAGPRLRPTPLRVFRQTVWHYVKSGRPELFMYDRDSIKA